MWVRTRRKRCKRCDEPFHGHYLTFSCFQRRPFFAGRLAPGWFMECLDGARRRAPFELWAYVIMPEHVHLIIRPSEGSTIRQILYHIKRPLTNRVLAWVMRNRPDFLAQMEERRPGGKVTRRFWQAGGGYDRNLWSAREIHEKIQYVHNNPVRRKLVENAANWSWSSARAWET